MVTATPSSGTPSRDRIVDDALRTTTSSRTDASGKTVASDKNKTDEFVSDDSKKKDPNKKEGEVSEAEKTAAGAFVEGLLAEARSILTAIGSIMRANINANPGMQFSKHNTAVGKATEAADLANKAQEFAAVKEVKNLQSSALTVGSLAKSIRGMMITGAELWKGMIPKDREDRKNVDKLASRE